MNIPETSAPKKNWSWLYDLLLIGVLLVGAVLRFSGSDWGELQHQHPDELFFTSVTYDIKPVHSLAQYFNSATSTLNPQNMGHGFYAYGTLPIFITRGLYDLAVETGKLKIFTLQLPPLAGDMKLFGRQMSAVADLLAVALLYLIAKRLYGPRVAILASLFSALAVMQIQQSHFYTTDNFTTFFMFLATFFAVELMAGGKESTGPRSLLAKNRFLAYLESFFRDRLFWLSAAFGIAMGMAVASKLNAAPLVILLPVALAVRYFRRKKAGLENPGGRTAFEDFLVKNFGFMVIGAIFTLLSFRVFQPYAFTGIFTPNKLWISSIRDQRNQASPNADLPWALQWARRTHLYSFTNLTEWGLGLPLGILAWAGFLWMGWRILKGEWKQHLLLWSWTALYFGWQSLQYNPTMRYELPIYPLLAMMAAWAVFDWARPQVEKVKRINWRAAAAWSAGGIVLALTACWAVAFVQIYVHPEPRIAASNWIYQNAPGPINLHIQAPDGSVYQQPLPFTPGGIVTADQPYRSVFMAQSTGVLTQVLIGYISDNIASGPQTLTLVLSTTPDPAPDQILAGVSVAADFAPISNVRGKPLLMTFDPPMAIQKGVTYNLTISTTGGQMAITGSAVANETDFDYGLPFRTAYYDGFGGIYRGDLNLQVYWDDNADKLARFQDVLNQTDYIFIPTNHQYGQITRIPERYPLTTVYYRDLIGCPADKDIIWCYRVAEPGMFQGSLGFELAATFEDYPTLGPLVINDQPAEEAFTFYDHPKVLIFRKSADYDPAKVAAILGAVDISRAVHLTPGQADNYRSLMLPAEQVVAQQEGGTWSELFNRNAFYNVYPGLGAALWYLTIFALGLFMYPLVRAAFPGLADHGYPLARFAGLLLWAWLSWMAGSAGIPYSKLTIGLALGLIALIGAVMAWRQRAELKEEFRRNWKYFLLVEGLFLALFLLDLFIRLGNSDLWHPAKGGERPMDFAYFNAILKSTTFPPYDPWYAGGYINYYYYGYVIVGTPVKLLGIVPSIAFNFILPTLFACLGMSAFSVAWNLLSGFRAPQRTGEEMLPDVSAKPKESLFDKRFIAGISAAAAMVLIGNLGVVRMLYQGFIQIGSQVAKTGANVATANIFQRIWWAIQGFFLSLGGVHLPYGLGNWYWDPSRILPPGPGNEITEFPLFTFLYSDLHAHMIAFTITVLAIAWALSVLISRARWKTPVDAVAGFFLGALVIGALKPTNTWDVYTYLILCAVVLAYAIWRYADVSRLPLPLSDSIKRPVLAVLAAGVLVAFSFILYQPFSHSFSQAYNSVEVWKGPLTPLTSYLTHWGVFLFFITSWLVWETRQWLAETPVSALNKLRPYRDLIIGALIIFVLVLVAQQAWVMLPRPQNAPWRGVTILWLALPLAVWAAVLLLRPGLPEAKRLVLFMVGTSLLVTMVVELVVLRGDIGRMNTVFKFYLQAWIMLGISAAAAFGWLLPEFRKWLPGWRIAWQAVAVFLVAGAALFLLMGGLGKIKDRMTEAAPHTLDSMTYMAYAMYADYGTDLNLSEDYRAIRWMQDNVQGSPVIAETPSAGVQYQWHNRFSIYTGLPDVVGWEWHQVQQRVFFTEEVKARGREEDGFYMTTDINAAQAFLRKYNVRYIIVGQLERAKYKPGAPEGPVLAGEPDGLLKFEQYNGTLWHEVYRDGQTVIYEVPGGGEVNP